jgi:hypothetical protein
MADGIIDFQRFRKAAAAERQRRREEAFDRELRRRLDLFLAGKPIPSEPIADNPYLQPS